MKRLISPVIYLFILSLVACSESDTVSTTPSNGSATPLDRLYFSAKTENIGKELWSSDGTEAGTKLVKDINKLGSSNPSRYTEVNGSVFFVARNNASENVLYKKIDNDVSVVKVLNSGNYLGFNSPVVFNNLLFFEAYGDAGLGLWVSDGTDAGTKILTVSNIRDITTVPSKGIFFKDNSNRLWVTDGTEAGTLVLTTFGVDTLVSTSTKVFFTDNSELWVSDGTVVGTSQIVSATTDTFGSIGRMAEYGNKLYFSANTSLAGVTPIGYELWSTDGTNAGTSLFIDVYPGSQSGMDSYYSRLTVANNLLMFTGYDGTGSSSELNIWSSDGTVTGTVKLTDDLDAPVSIYKYGNINNNFKAAGNKVYFSNRANSSHLWVTDGTIAGTSFVSSGVRLDYSQTLAAVETGIYLRSNNNLIFSDGTGLGTLSLGINIPYSNNSNNYQSIDNTLYFIVESDNSESSKRLMKSDGTLAGTMKLEDLDGYYSNTSMLALNDQLIFTNYDTSHGVEPWVSNGTPGNATLLSDINTSTSGDSRVRARIGFNELMYFIVDDGVNQYSLWKSNGTDDGTQLVKALKGNWLSSKLVVSGNKFYFSMDTNGNGNELWVSDGTTAGTQMLELAPSDLGVSIGRMVDVNGTLYIAANNELWKTDGTLEGTDFVALIHSYAMTRVGDSIYFAHEDGLWKTDGTFIGTEFIRGNLDIDGDDDELTLMNLNGTLIFLAYDGLHGSELWKSDGTYDGTQLVKDIVPDGGLYIEEDSVAILNNELFFSADDGIHGSELWKTDGTEAGTAMVKDINTEGDGYYSGIAVLDGLLYFRAGDNDILGRELWVSDGTEAGTVIMKNIFSDDYASSYPQDFEVNSGKLFFQVDSDETDGYQLWSTDGTETGTVLIKDFPKTDGFYRLDFFSEGFFSENYYYDD